MHLHVLRGRRPSNGRSELRVALWVKVKARVRGLGLQPIGCTPALSATQERQWLKGDSENCQ